MLRSANWAIKILAVGFLTLLAYLPFHALLSTWAISNFGYELVFKSAKELLLLGVLFPVSVYVAIKEPAVLKTLWSRIINKLIFAYVALNGVLALVLTNSAKSEIAGLVFNLRFFALFMLAQILIMKLPNKQFKELSLRFIFWAGVVVVGFGALQVLVLPNDFLRHFGYGAAIIPPYFTVDNNEGYIRILSTLRGPNILGAYLVFWLPFLLLVTRRMWPVAVKYRIWAGLIWAASLVTLFGTRSRSAWLGACIALGICVALVANTKYRKQLIYVFAAVLAGLAVAFALTWNTNFVQTTLWHRDPTESNSVNSDDQRQSSLKTSLSALWGQPFGQGVGSTNIASTYGTEPATVENYYLQVALELGIAGLLVFAAITVLVAIRLWQQRSDDISAALFAGLIGISVIGVLLPVWGDETLSMLWWGMAGLCVFNATKKSRRKSDAISG